MEFSIIAALTQSGGIGFQNTLPWNVKEDMEHFRKMTDGQVVIMGRKTWESLKTPLKNRTNLIVTQDDSVPTFNVRTLKQALNFLSMRKFFVIGGQQLFSEAILSPLCKTLYLTHFNFDAECDTFFPKIPPYFKVIEETPFSKGVFKTYTNITDLDSQENQYLNLLSTILSHGEERDDRTGKGTLSIFGTQMRFSLANNTLPLLTTKKVFWRGIVEELLFFLRGDHDNRKLQAKNVHIWDGNTSRDYLDQNNPKLETHDLAKAYGVQWRAAGAPLQSLDESYKGKGIDQIQQIIELLKTDPYSRRIILNAWNVSDLKDMALVPCHMLYQFYVSHSKERKILNCMMIQRSADTFLGLPFNIASTSLLTYILAKTCKMEVGKIIINIGDAHIYKNHVEQVKKQLERTPIQFPKISINKNLNSVEDIEQLNFEDFELSDYHCWPGIKAEMAV